jgi:hypothetical protein
MGMYVTVGDNNTINRKSGQTTCTGTDICALRGKRIVVYDEAPGINNTSFVKALMSGAELSVREIRKAQSDPVRYPVSPIFLSNSLLQSPDEALMEKMRLVTFKTRCMIDPHFEQGQILRRTDLKPFLNTTEGGRQAHGWLVKCALFFASRMHSPPPVAHNMDESHDTTGVDELIDMLVGGQDPFLKQYCDLQSSLPTYAQFYRRLQLEYRPKEGVSMKLLTDLFKRGASCTKPSFIRSTLDRLKQLNGVFPFASSGEWCWVWSPATTATKNSKTTCIVNLVLTGRAKEVLLSP